MAQMWIVSEHACEGSWCTPNQEEFAKNEKLQLEGWALFQQFRFVFSDEQQKDLDEMNLKALKKIRAARTERDKTNASTVLADPTEMIPLMDASGNAAPGSSSSSSSTVMAALPHLDKASVSANANLGAAGKIKRKSLGAAANASSAKKAKSQVAPATFSIHESDPR